MPEKNIEVNFIGIGAARAASTWIYSCLKEHPQICVSKDKEFNLFDDQYQLKKPAKIRKQFDRCNPDQIKGIYTPFYLAFDEKIPVAIKENLPDTKIIACLREPVERAYSHYLLEKSIGKNVSFEEAIKELPKIINYGLYHKHLSKYFDLFPKDNIFIILYNDIKENPLKSIQAIYRFLKVNPNFTPEQFKTIINPTTEKRLKFSFINKIQPIELKKSKLGYLLIKTLKALGFNHATYKKIKKWNSKNIHKIKADNKIDNKILIKKGTKEYLKKIYQEDINNLEKLINRDLSSWKKHE